MRFRILFISGCLDDARRLTQLLQPLPVYLDYAETLRQARNIIRREVPDAILTAADLTDGNWLDVLDAAGSTPVVVTDPQADARMWSEVLNRGGFDLLTQPFYAPEVRRILENAAGRPAAMAAV